GLVQEVRALHERDDLLCDLPALRAVGYRQLLDWLAGQCSYEEAVRLAVVATRRYAKRQLTWLRGERDCTVMEVDAAGGELVVKKALETLCEALVHAKMLRE